eukprot:TRINITY_DN2662_c0_g1_i2.p1 TRINITY_DN2662_c0_g1~~TRINITY_DN2662_c0_g1_i2.p1  ORF type:complete len:383 (-),score=63.13 TRINITY_DN2662_c0_g1_i2:458-1510(-)
MAARQALLSSGAEDRPRKRFPWVECLLCVGFLLAVPVACWDRYKVGLSMPHGYTRDGFIQCTFQGHQRRLGALCSAEPIHCPGMDSPERQVLLLSNGLVTPHIEGLFTGLLNAAAAARPEQLPAAGKSVFLILDAPYAAFVHGTQYSSPETYCQLRTNELTQLGASSVFCALLGPEARQGAIDYGEREGGYDKTFGDYMRKLDDDKLLEELELASVVWVEMGTPGPLMDAARRELKLTKTYPLLGNPRTFEDALRFRVLDGTGSLGYVGVSTGSIVAGESIGYAMPPHTDQDEKGFRLLSGCSVWPHAKKDDDWWLKDWGKNYDTITVPLTDCTALAHDKESSDMYYDCD